MSTLKLGTRGSKLALTQSGQVADAITAATGRPVELVVISTRGDRVTDRPLQEVGGKGLFTKELEDAMLAGEIHFAVHSMKDMPTEDPPGLIIASVPTRVDPRDCLVGSTLAGLREGAVVGTGSIRRSLQLKAARPDLDIRGIRGNVDTRIAKQRSGEYDAIVLAMAGLTRLGLAEVADEAIDAATMIPAVGQGALAVQARRDDAETLAVLEAIHDPRTAACVEAERSFLIGISGGCSVPAAAHAVWEGDQIAITGIYAADGETMKKARLAGDPLHVTAMGRELAKKLK
ncbi:MAG: hydroxymethylbilane synthase [Alphaproteobacteria bacterium]|nr:hydroxymethylbilane synthase [Alphaproteobacteria bacterium]